MATNLIRFEIRVPNSDFGSPHDLAFQQFLTSMRTLCDVTNYNIADWPMGGQGYEGFNQGQSVYGYITTAQQAQALSFLNTLNAALGFQVLCTVSQVTTEP